MLAYVFWHWPQTDEPAADYEALQAHFHTALAQSAPLGFQRSFVFRAGDGDGQAPWLGGTPAYADWYLVDDSAALDPLNVAAVSGICEQPHARVAQAMAAGVGSLFALRTGSADLASARQATFLTKPRSMSYADFDAQVPAIEGTSLWRRQMVLGPTPEFALLSASPLPPADDFQALPLALAPIWPR